MGSTHGKTKPGNISFDLHLMKLDFLTETGVRALLRFSAELSTILIRNCGLNCTSASASQISLDFGIIFGVFIRNKFAFAHNLLPKCCNTDAGFFSNGLLTELTLLRSEPHGFDLASVVT